MFYFNSRSETLTVVLTPSIKQVVGTQVILTPGKKARFVGGMFMTEDAEVAQLLRDAMKRSDARDIVEITAEDQRIFSTKKAKNQRGPVTALQSSKAAAAGRLSVPEKADEAEQLTCPICDPPKPFATRRALNMHLVSHRPGVQLGEQPAGGLATAPAAKVE
jgi:hypothetical protein